MNNRSSRLTSDKKVIGIAILIVVMLILNITASVFIFFDIRILEMPDTTIEVNIIEIDPEKAVIQYIIDVFNPSNLELFLEDFKVVANTKDGKEIARIDLEGGNIPSKEKRTYSGSDTIKFKGKQFAVLTSEISGIIGVKLLGIIKKTLPIKINLITSAEEIIDDIKSPIINIWGDFGEITTEKVTLAGEIEVYNPNSIEIYLEDISAEIKTEKGTNVGNLEIKGGKIPAKSTINLYGEGYVLIEALNAETLNINISSTAGVKIAGLSKSIDLTVFTHINIPKIEDIFNQDIPTDASIKSDIRATLGGFVADITLEIKNPNTISIVTKNVTFSMFRIDKDKETLIGECCIQEGEVGPGEVLSLKASIPLPYRKLLFSRGNGFLPDAILIRVRTNLTIPGLDQHVWVGVEGYQDFHPFF